MKVEYEATFENINKEKVRSALKSLGAVLVRKEFLQTRSSFGLPKGHEIEGGWIRVRDEGDKKTLALKVIDGDKIEDQKEEEVIVSNIEKTEAILSLIGCKKKAYQETKREIWKLDKVEIMIDEWPFLEPFVEIESSSEEKVRSVAEKLGFDYGKAFFGCVATLYAKKYDISEDAVNNNTEAIIFGGNNPFLRNEVGK